jgi:hypothetical protein
MIRKKVSVVKADSSFSQVAPRGYAHGFPKFYFSLKS